jgi:demethylmenaquinone methyltransferase/2-methoxy-6-polyprenyl-1,4-benzoquinol methylase
MADPLLAEQIAYYRARAPEYDRTSTPPNDRLRRFGDRLDAALDAFSPRGDVLEIASGTGIWTEKLLRHASSVHALDAAPEMHAIARARLGGDPRVSFIAADVFEWEPDRRYDVVFFANWLSHVPRARFAELWEAVGRALRVDGRVFVVDELVDAWREDVVADAGTDAEGAEDLIHRALLDGRSFRVVKVFWTPDRLGSALRDVGWTAHVEPVGPFFYLIAQRSDRSRKRTEPS